MTILHPRANPADVAVHGSAGTGSATKPGLRGSRRIRDFRQAKANVLEMDAAA
jgi:hypothetical protein